MNKKELRERQESWNDLRKIEDVSDPKLKKGLERLFRSLTSSRSRRKPSPNSVANGGPSNMERTNPLLRSPTSSRSRRKSSSGSTANGGPHNGSKTNPMLQKHPKKGKKSQ